MRHSREDDGKREKRKWCQGPGGFQNGLGKVPCIYMFSDWRGEAGASGHAGNAVSIPQAHTSRPYIPPFLLFTDIILLRHTVVVRGDLPFNTRDPVYIYFCNNGVSYLQAMTRFILAFLKQRTHLFNYLPTSSFRFRKTF